MNTNKTLLILLILFLIAFFGLWMWRGCERKPEPVITEPAKSEAERKSQIVIDSAGRAEYRKQAQYWETRYKADSARLAAATGKAKQAEQKARESAAEYAKTPNLPNCNKALQDCQYENETKAYSLAVQERMLNAADSLDKVQVAEIDRQSTTIDSAFAGWGKSKTGWADAEQRAQHWEKKAKKRGKIIGWCAAIIAAAVGGAAAAR